MHRHAQMKTEMARIVARDLRDERSFQEITRTNRGNIARIIYRGAIRMSDQAASVADEMGVAMRNRDPNVSNPFTAFSQSRKEVHAAWLEGHAQNVEEILGRAAEGKMTEADRRNILTYGRANSHSLQDALAMGDAVHGRSGRATSFASAAKLADKDMDAFVKNAPGIVAELQLERFRGDVHGRKVEYLRGGEHLASGKNFEQGYIPTQKEYEQARAIASNPEAMDRLSTGASKMAELRRKYPDKTDEQFAAMGGKKGKHARAALEAERTYNTLDDYLNKGLQNRIRQPHEPMADRLQASRPSERTQERDPLAVERERARKQKEKEAEQDPQGRQNHAPSAAKQGRYTNAFQDRERTGQAAKAGRHPNFSKASGQRQAKQQEASREAGRSQGGAGMGGRGWER